MLQGYRGWLVKRINGKMTLTSPMSKYHWAKTESTAFCNACSKLVTLWGPVRTLRTDIAEGCSCGIYALRTPEAVIQYFHSGGIDVIGRVFLYGRVIEGDLGYRAEKAKVDMLLMPTMRRIPQGEIIELANEYGVHVVVARGDLRQKIEKARNKRSPCVVHHRTTVQQVMKARYPWMFEEGQPAHIEEESRELDSLEQRIQWLERTIQLLNAKIA